VLKKLMVWASVLVIAALLSVPAFAQTADLSLMWGSDEWLINQFGDENGDLTEFCLAASEDRAGWSAQFPNLVGLCGWTV
jgi:hypothetical protein